MAGSPWLTEFGRVLLGFNVFLIIPVKQFVILCMKRAAKLNTLKDGDLQNVLVCISG